MRTFFIQPDCRQNPRISINICKKINKKWQNQLFSREILGLTVINMKQQHTLLSPPPLLILPRSANSVDNLKQSVCITLLQ